MSTRQELRRLAWRCRRGVLELDLILGDFLREVYPRLAAAEQQAFRRLLRLSDQTLLDYLYGKETPAEEELRNVVKKL